MPAHRLPLTKQQLSEAASAFAPSRKLRVHRVSTRPEEASSEQAGNTWTLSHIPNFAKPLASRG